MGAKLLAMLRTGIAAASLSVLFLVSGAAQSVQAASSRSREGTTEVTTGPVPNLEGYDIYRPTDLNAVHHKLPVVAWANGGCVRANSPWAPLFDAWVKAGFLVVAIGPPPGAASATFSTVADQDKIVDWAYSENSPKGSPYHDRIDLKGIVAAGNSCGGVSSVQLAAQDHRVNAVFVLSGSSTLPGTPESKTASIMDDVHVPIGYVEGGPTDISVPQSNLDYTLVPKGVPIYQAHRFSGDHVTISLGVLPEDAQISTKWIEFSLYGGRKLEQQLLTDPCQSCAPGTWTVRAKNLSGLASRH